MQAFFNDYGVYLIIVLLMILLVVFYFVNKSKLSGNGSSDNEIDNNTFQEPLKKEDVFVKETVNPVSDKVVEKNKPIGKNKPVEETSTEDDDPSKDVVTKDKPARYHVSQNKDDKSQFFKKWRIRKEGSNKTIKYYDTQKEAILVAEDLAEKAGTSIVIHKVDGKIRKQDYSKK